MGKVAEENADRLIITNDNPRSESPETIAKDIRAGINGEVFTELDRAKAIHMAILQAHSDDWVVVAGKGHETTQTIGTKVLPFSDREQVLAALQVAA
jgi:UDP-N-acetylmuramoyl-L-alanyl-D-glutamate--2,6-diaminopimelate ligase